jgi:hypothetical protein
MNWAMVFLGSMGLLASLSGMGVQGTRWCRNVEAGVVVGGWQGVLGVEMEPKQLWPHCCAGTSTQTC